MNTKPSPSLGRRLLPAVALTTAASGLIALLDQPSSGSADGVGGVAAAPGSGAAANGAVDPNLPSLTSTTPPAVVPAQPVPAADPAQPVATVAPGAQPQPQAQVQPQATTAPLVKQPAAASGTCTGDTVDGPTVNTRWGPVQVEAVVSASHQICNVQAIQSPSSHNKSVRINNVALPILHKQVMNAQSTNINGVSGATITSSGYARSLQSLLDGLG
jgi:uncharacterized protein with FMN-binding domain